MHCDLLSVLDEGVACSNLHSDSVHSLHSKDVWDAALQGDERLQKVNRDNDIKIRMILTQNHNVHLSNPELWYPSSLPYRNGAPSLCVLLKPKCGPNTIQLELLPEAVKVSLTLVNTSWNILPLSCNPLCYEHLSRAQSTIAESVLQNALLYTCMHARSAQLLYQLYITHGPAQTSTEHKPKMQTLLQTIHVVHIQGQPLLLLAQIHPSN